MSRKLQSFEIVKLTSTRLRHSKLKIVGSLADFRNNGEIVRIGNCQLLDTIRQITGKYHNQELLDWKIKEKERIARLPDNESNRERLLKLNSEIDGMLYCPYLVSVMFDSNKHYDKIVNGFEINGKRFIRLLSSSGSLRRSTIFFVEESIRKAVFTTLNNDRNENVKIVPAKFLAYMGLNSSATLRVSTPNIVVVPDYKITRNTKVDYVKDHGATITEEVVPIEFNCFDGQGLISKEYARQWADELDLAYVPSWFIIRGNWTKGNLVTFDTRKFAQVSNAEYVTDVWGKKHRIETVDVFLSASQMKMWQCYDSCEQWLEGCYINDLYFGVSRYAPERDKTHSFMNYQFLQTLDIAKEEIPLLCQDTVTWINNVANNESDMALLFLAGECTQKQNFLKDNTVDIVIRAMSVNSEVANDPYVRQRIQRDLIGKVKESYLGNLLVHGNYQIMISDPVAQMEWICGKRVEGLLKEGEAYSYYWLFVENMPAEITLFRAPLTIASEVNVKKLSFVYEKNDWYSYITSGIIYNIRDDSVLRHADSDWDGDLCCSTDSEVIRKAARGGNPVYYDKLIAEKVLITENRLRDTEKKSLGTAIGYITNTSTSMQTLLAEFDVNSPEAVELRHRILLTRFYQGSEIDRAKTGTLEKMPAHWTQYTKTTTDMSDDEIEKAKFNNRVAVLQRPYFFTWLYPHYLKKYRKEIRSYDNLCYLRYGKSFNEKLEDKTEESLELSQRYKRFSYFIDNNSLMNNISHYMQSQLEYIQKKNGKSNNDYDWHVLLGNGDNYCLENEEKMKGLLKKYISIKHNKHDKEDLSGYLLELHNEALDILSNEQELATLAVLVTYQNNKSLDFAWKMFPEGLLLNIISNSSGIVKEYVQDDDGDIEYLWGKYKLVETKLGE